MIIYISSCITQHTFNTRIPRFILERYFKEILYSFVEKTLSNTTYITFEMMKDEFKDFCTAGVETIIKNFNAWNILYVIIKDYFKK